MNGEDSIRKEGTNIIQSIEKPHGHKKKYKTSRKKQVLLRKLRQLREFMRENPNLNSQLIIILITLTSGSVPMDRRIDDLTLMMEKIHNATEMVNKTMESVRVATEIPRQIRQLFEENYMQ